MLIYKEQNLKVQLNQNVESMNEVIEQTIGNP